MTNMATAVQMPIDAADYPEPMIPRPFKVLDMGFETSDTFTFSLEAQDGRALAFQPGQFNMLYAFGIGEAPISISGRVSDPGTLVHTVRSVGPVTAAFSRLQPGQVIGVRGPFGRPWPVQQAKGKDVVIITGGIGLAPLRPAIYHILDNRQDYGEVTLLYGARSPQDMLYTDEFQQWRARLDIEAELTVDTAEGDWRGHVGVVTTLMPSAQFDPENTLAMICGPEIMMRFSILELRKRGVPEENIYVSMERNMKCGLGVCGHCQIGPVFVCKDGPVFRYDEIKRWFEGREI